MIRSKRLQPCVKTIPHPRMCPLPAACLSTPLAQEAWEGCLVSSTDVKELIPEFFMGGKGDFLVNAKRLPLGVRQSGRCGRHAGSRSSGTAWEVRPLQKRVRRGRHVLKCPRLGPPTRRHRGSGGTRHTARWLVLWGQALGAARVHTGVRVPGSTHGGSL